MLNEEGNLSSGIKLIDFGISGKLSLELLEAGTLRYCPPELISEGAFKADPSFDVWSLGVLLFKLVFGEYPFNAQDLKEVKKLIVEGKFKFPTGVEVSAICKTAIKLFLTKDYKKRPKLYDVASHPWFKVYK